MKLVSNIIQSILLFVTVILTIISFTLLNNKFIVHNFEKQDLYITLYKENTIDVSYKQFVKNTNKYIKSHYSKKYIDNSFSKYLSKYNIKKYSYIIYLLNILLIIITGSLFIKLKNKHNLQFILAFSSILCIIYAGFVNIFISTSNDLVNKIIINYNNYNLFYAIAILDYLIVKKIFNKCK